MATSFYQDRQDKTMSYDNYYTTQEKQAIHDLHYNYTQEEFETLKKNEMFILDFCENNPNKIQKVNNAIWGECLLLNYNTIISLVYSNTYKVLFFAENCGVEKNYFGYFGNDKRELQAWHMKYCNNIQDVLDMYYDDLFYHLECLNDNYKSFHLWLNNYNKNYKEIDEYAGDIIPEIKR